MINFKRLFISVIALITLGMFAKSAYAMLDPVEFWTYPGQSFWGDRGEVSWNWNEDAEVIWVEASYNADWSNKYVESFSGDCTSIMLTLRQNDTPLYIRVTAQDKELHWEYAETYIYTRSSYPPAKPVLVSPEYNSSIDGYSGVNGSTVAFDWIVPKYANSVKWTIAEDPWFDRIVYNSGKWWDKAYSGATAWNFLNDGRDYYWKVQAKNWSGLGPESDIYYFKNGSSRPTTPQLISPAPYAQFPYGGTVSFDWKNGERATSNILQTSHNGWEFYPFGSTSYDFGNHGDTHYWRVVASNYNGETHSETRSFKSGIYPPPPPIFWHPDADDNTSGTEVSFMWVPGNDKIGIIDLELQIARDPNFTDMFYRESGWFFWQTVPGFKNDGQRYYYRVIAHNLNGSNYSATGTFVNNPNLPPTLPRITSPSANGASITGTSTTIQWSPADRATEYLLKVGTDPSFASGSLVFNQSIGLRLSQSVALRDDGSTYYVRVEAKNIIGSTLSETRSFVNVPSSPPTAPVLDFPIDGELLEWTAAYLSWFKVSKATGYLLEVATNSSFTQAQSYTLGDVNYYILDLPNDGSTYYWRVAARNAAGTGAYSSPGYFTHVLGAAPDRPTLLTPANDSISPDEVYFSWTAAANADSYDLLISTDLYSWTTFPGIWGNMPYLSLSLGNAGMTHYWKVVAKNEYGSTESLEIGSFINSRPTAPTLLTPLNGAKIYGDETFLEWYPVDGATSYWLQVATGLEFDSENLVYNGSVESETKVVVLGEPGQIYYWRVVARIGYASGPLSETRNFVTRPEAPEIPPLAYAPNDITAGGHTVNFTWSAVPFGNDYLLQVSKDPYFSSKHYDRWLGNTTKATVGSFPDDGGRYYWRVAARNTVYPNIITAFAAATFINGPVLVHDAPVPVSPVNTNIPGKGITFSWQPVARADSYIIQISRDPQFTTLLGGAQNIGGTSIYLSGEAFDNVGHVFYWRVAAANEYNTGSFSFPASFTNGTLPTNTGTEQGQVLEVCTGSSTNVATGVVSHEQELFSTKGAPLSTALRLYYNSLPPYNGPLGLGWSHSYDMSIKEEANGSLVFRDGDGARSFYFPSGDGYISQKGDTSKASKNADGTLRITYRDGSKYNFNQSGQISSIADRYGNTMIFVYTDGDLTTITDSAHRATVFNYDKNASPHRIMSITDPDQNTYDFAYEGNLLYKVINPLPDPSATEREYWEYLYDSEGYLKSKSDPERNKTQYWYYEDHLMQSSIDPEGVVDPTGHTRTLVYPITTDNIRTTTFTEKDGGVWLFTYDVQDGVLKQKTDPNGNVHKFAYYPSGYLKAKTEPKDGAVSLTTFYTYDNFGNILTQTEPVDLSVYEPDLDPETVTDPTTLQSLSPPIITAFSYSYDNANFDRITSISDLRGSTPLITTFAYSLENGGEVITKTEPGNVITITRKNPNGSVKEVIDANQKQTMFTYYPDTTDNRSGGRVGLLQSVTGADGVTNSVAAYDKNGNPLDIRLTDRVSTLKLTTLQEFDALNRLRKLTKKTANLPDNVIGYSYDGNGNLESVTDAESRSTGYAYNYNRQITKITDAKLNDTIFSYSGSGCTSCGSGIDQLTAVYDAKFTKNTPLSSQPHTSFAYDSLGRIEYETDPLGKKIRNTYYDNGLLKEKYDATNAPEVLHVTFVYNERGQITDKIFTDGAFERYTYYLNGKLWTAANRDIGYTYTYFDDGRLHTVTDTTNNRVISYDEYDGLGQRKQMTVMAGSADQRMIGYDYDYANRPWHITSGDKTFTFGYDTLGRRNTLSYPNQVTASYVYDDLNRLASISHRKASGALLFGVSYPVHDQAGNRKTKTATEAETYLYDEIYRLLTVTSSKPEAFTYDAVGNRQSGPGPKDTGTGFYQHNDANQMTKGRRLSYGYDNAGNQTARTIPGVTGKTWTQTWDYNNRLIKVEKVKGANSRIVTFKYDPFGRRIEKRMVLTINGVTKTTRYSYLYDNDNIVYEEFTDENGVTTKTHYTHGPSVDEHLALERNGQFYYYHADGLGSITAISDASQNPVQEYSYESYGAMKAAMDFRNSYTFTGREWDKETGLYFYRARYYDPMEGRFISKDPIGLEGGISLFSYVKQNPINYTDPAGLEEISAEAYFLFGGGIAVGKNNDGSLYIKVRLGAGEGGGVKYDPRAQSPGYNPKKACDNAAAAVNFYSEAEVGYGPSVMSVSGKLGLHSKDKKEAYVFNEVSLPNPAVSQPPATTLKMSYSLGVEGTLLLRPFWSK